MSLKVRLLLGAAAPLVFALPAAAQTTISTSTTTPISTSTANSGAAADVVIAAGGSITPPSNAGTTIVTVDSNNTVTNNGALTINNADNATGVKINTNLTTNYSGTGTISVLEDYTRTDTDGDGDLDGPLAQGTGRAGILVLPGGTMNGNFSLGSGSVVTVEGNNSLGISIQSILNGNYRQLGAISLIGSNGTALDFQKDVTGNVGIGGSVSSQGEGSVAVNVGGNVAGEFMIDGAILATGFTSTTVSNYADPDLLTATDVPIAQRRDPDDLLIGGAAVQVRGNLARGFLVQGNAVGGVDPTDDVKDVVQDFNENRTAGQISQFGSAPAVVIQPLDGSSGQSITLSKVRESVADTLDDDKDGDTTEIIGVFNYDYGFMNRGSIAANGFNIGFASTGIKIAGSADGTHTTFVDGGVFNGGTIAATAFEAKSVGLLIGSGASTPQVVNIGSISSTVFTENTDSATAFKIEAGATVPTITNNGLMLTTVRGYDGDSIAFQDLSGTVTHFTNTSRISAGYVDDDTTDNITSGLGRAIGIDLSHNTTGITLLQQDTPDNARIFGDVLLGSGNDRFDLLSGEVHGNVDFGAGADTFNIVSAKMFGNAVFHGGGTNFTLSGSDMTGDISLAGSANLSFLGSSTFNGAISNSAAGAVALTVDNSTVNRSGSGTLDLASFNATNGAKIGFVVDNARVAGNVPIFNVTGTANFAANTVFTPIFQQFTNQDFTLRVLNAGTLNLGGPLDSMLNANSPYLYTVGLQRPNPNAIDLVFKVKTPTELGLTTRQASAYTGVLDLLANDATIGAAVTSIPGSAEFLRGWNDLLPAPDSSIMTVLASNATAAFGATAHRLDLLTDKPDAPGGAWTEEFGVQHNADASSSSAAVSGGGFGVAAGVDLISSGTALVGTYISLESLELEEENRTKAPLNVSQTSVGGYAGWRNGALAVNAAASAGFIDFTSDRRVSIGSLTDRLRAEWKGTTYNAAARATYDIPMGWFDFKPYIAADYMGFQQDGYRESADTLDDLEAVTESSDATLATASYGLSLVGHWGSDDAYKITPELSVGYRNVLTWDDTPGKMHFGGSTAGSSFTLLPGQEPEDGIVAGLGLNINSQFLNLKLGYDAQISDSSVTHYGSITLRMAFW
ncbi:MAG TPA: autotransporter domain-containing protein [Hyphomonadaceae bacterium]|nr:autotransporter domain-containing protein [Hyphomonadaceae bacterium]